MTKTPSTPMTNEDSPGSTGAADASTDNKPKRVRTGCLTCRERHLKCDEGLPSCQNCRKSSRVCKRGVRLNFIDTKVMENPILSPTPDWAVQFQDESRLIASEYKGGLNLYAAIEQTITPPHEPPLELPIHSFSIDPNIAMHNALPPIIQPGAPGLYPESGTGKHDNQSREGSHHHSHTNSSSSYLPTALSTSYGNPEQTLTPPTETREYLSTPEEVLFMQVFVEEVGLWMDSMDPMKHFSRLLPFHALGEPMLLNAFLACGARHLTLVNPIYHEDKALYYYDTATTQLLRALQNPDRDTVVCATTAVILNVYEIMSERAHQRMNHIAGARALIKECGWSARSTGIGSACFWLNVGMELLSCLHFNWQVAWEPDQWGIDMDFSRDREVGREELWVHRMVYITAKIANFRASIPRFQEPSAHEEQLRLNRRYSEWQNLKELCDSWNASVPRTMRPIGYLYPNQTASKSLFPEVWLIKRSTITGRLFYHTAMCLIAQINPLLPPTSPSMASLLLEHAHQICGIVAHVKDRGVASVALRSMAIAAEVLVDRAEQEEVLQIFDKVKKETGWNISFLHKELVEKWGWNQDNNARSNGLSQFFPGQNNNGSGMGNGNLPPAGGNGQQGQGGGQGGQNQGQSQQAAAAAQSRMARGGILNPLLKTADFSLPNHPYQQYYQPPNLHARDNVLGSLGSLGHLGSLGNLNGGGLGNMGFMAQQGGQGYY